MGRECEGHGGGKTKGEKDAEVRDMSVGKNKGVKDMENGNRA